MSEEKLNIYQRINEVRKKVAYLRKDKKVEGYKAITHDQVTASIRKFLIEFGIIIIPNQTSWETAPTTKTTKSGTPYTRFEGDYEFEVVNMDDPKDRFTGKVHAHAEDHGDKGPGKALSYALKGFEVKLLNIETGEDDEQRPEQETVKITEEEIITLRELCDSYDFPVDETLTSLANKVYRVKEIKDLPAEKFDSAVNRLAKKYAE